MPRGGIGEGWGKWCVVGGVGSILLFYLYWSDSDRFVFLLCTRAGGLGINLTGQTCRNQLVYNTTATECVC